MDTAICSIQSSHFLIFLWFGVVLLLSLAIEKQAEIGGISGSKAPYIEEIQHECTNLPFFLLSTLFWNTVIMAVASVANCIHNITLRIQLMH